MAYQQKAPTYGQQPYGQQQYGQPPITHQPNAQQQMSAANDITSHFMVGCSKLLAGICFPCGKWRFSYTLLKLVLSYEINYFTVLLGITTSDFEVLKFGINDI